MDIQEQNKNDEEIKCSVVIPVYNAAQYIKRCIESVCEITKQDMEIILINDGSTDNSLQICQSMRCNDSRIRVYTQANRGVSFSRNRGVNLARGKWITFVDADDIINSFVYEQVMDSLNDEMAFFCVGSRMVQDSTPKRKKTDIVEKLDIKNLGKEDVKRISLSLMETDKRDCRKLKKLGIDFINPWGKFYDIELLQKNYIVFREDIAIGEDRIFNYQYYQHIHDMHYTTLCGYYYYQNQKSAMNGYQEGKKDKLLASVLAFYEVAPDHIYEMSQYGIRHYLFALKLDFCHPNNTKNYQQRKREALALRQEKIIDQCFQQGKIFRLRPAAIPIAVLAKFHVFVACNFLLKVKARMGIRF